MLIPCLPAYQRKWPVIWEQKECNHPQTTIFWYFHHNIYQRLLAETTGAFARQRWSNPGCHTALSCTRMQWRIQYLSNSVVLEIRFLFLTPAPSKRHVWMSHELCARWKNMHINIYLSMYIYIYMRIYLFVYMCICIYVYLSTLCVYIIYICI